MTEENTEVTDAPVAAPSNDGFSLLDDSNPDVAPKQQEAGVRPDWLPESVWDAEKKAPKVDALLTEFQRADKIAKDLRVKLSKGEQNAPKTPDEYKAPVFEGDDAALSKMLDPSDPFVKGLNSIAHEAGLSQKQYETFMGKAAKMIAEQAGNAQAPTEMTAEEKEDYRRKVYDEIGPGAAQMVTAVAAHINMLKNQGQFSESELTEIKAMASTADGLKVLNKMRVLMGGESIPTNVDALAIHGLPSDAEIGAVIGSEKYMSGDPETIGKVDRWLDQRRQAGRPERLQF
jgi:hypothetical protein